MNVEHLLILLEEPSAKKMLDTILPRILPEGISFLCVAFQGKSDLMKNVALKIRAWREPNTAFLVMRDQDSGDCKEIKRQILAECASTFRSPDEYLVRIACHELESFYLGDLSAVREAGYKVSLSKKFKNGYTEPDSIANAADELSKITDGEYQKIAGSLAIAPHLKLDGSNKSTSFNMLISGIKKLVS